MSSNPKKAAPREKQVAMSAARYLVTSATHYINGNLQPINSIVSLPEGVRPGKYLVEVGADGEPIKKKGVKPDSAEADEPEKGKKAE